MPAPNEAVINNPSRPRIFIQFRRLDTGEESEPLDIIPTSMRLVSSITAQDLLEFTVQDPGYVLIDHPFLEEDLKTEVILRFGYASQMSETHRLVFFRQRPMFGEKGVSTTITCYDRGIFLKLPITPETIADDAGPVSIEDIIRRVVNEVNERYNAGLELDFDGTQYPEKYYRVTQGFGTPFEFLYWLRNFAAPEGSSLRDYPEVYVENNILHFHPARDGTKPQGKYEYNSDVTGQRLIVFEPEVNLYPNTVSTGDVDKEGDPTTATAGRTEGETDATVNLATRVSPDAGDVVDSTSTELSFGTYRVDQEKTLEEVASIFGDEVNAAEIAVLNDMETDAVLRPGQDLTIPVTAEAALQKQMLESARQTPAMFLARQSEAVAASATVIGDPLIRAGRPIIVWNLPQKWRGWWYVKEVTHTIDSKGYLMEMGLTREGFMGRGEGLEAAQGDTSPIEQVDDVEPEQQLRDMIEVSPEGGELRRIQVRGTGT